MKPDNSIRWGILGPGNIAEKFASDLRFAPGSMLAAIASRSFERAKEFAARYQVSSCYGSYSELVNDPAVDIVYIATPHSLHCENTLLCLENGKAVLCEKPFAINSVEAQRMVASSIRTGTFLMEAFWTRFNPVINMVKSIVDSGELGKIKILKADFGFQAPYNPQGRVFNPQLGGGSLLDVGVYPLFLAHLLMGEPDEISSLARLNHDGIDESCGMVLKYKDGAIATLSSSIVVNTEAEATISCEKGRIVIPSRWYVPRKALIMAYNKPELWVSEEFDGFGYQYEAVEANRCMKEGRTESPLLPHSFSLVLMKTLDRIRKQCNICYPSD